MKKRFFLYSIVMFGFMVMACVYAPRKRGRGSLSVVGASAKRLYVDGDGKCEDIHFETALLSGDNDDHIKTAIDLLKAGELVAVPSETVYGLGADASNLDAVNKIFEVKKRPKDHPFIIHIASFQDVPKWAKDVSPQAQKLADAFWPGPLTMVLHRADDVNIVVTGGCDAVALRCPSDPVFSKILKLADIGIAGPSANLHKKISTTTAAHVMKSLGGKIAAVVDGGRSVFGSESTIIDLRGDVPKILRPGPITQKEIEDVLGEVIAGFASHREAIPGNMRQHYQPITPAALMSIDDIRKCINDNPRKWFVVIHYSDFDVEFEARCFLIPLSPDKKAYAREMYVALHNADDHNFEQILIEEPPLGPEWEDVRDRLSKATALL